MREASDYAGDVLTDLGIVCIAGPQLRLGLGS